MPRDHTLYNQLREGEISPMTSLSADMLQLGVPLAEKILRPVIVYAFLVLFLRIFGKRELAQLNPFDGDYWPWFWKRYCAAHEPGIEKRVLPPREME